MRACHHFGLNVQVQLLLMTIFFFLIPDATPYLSLIFDSLLDLGGFKGKSTYIQHPGTAEPFRIAPAEPVAYTSLVKPRPITLQDPPIQASTIGATSQWVTPLDQVLSATVPHSAACRAVGWDERSESQHPPLT